MAAQIVTVFGGTGFLGRRIVRRLLDAGYAVRVASRHPQAGEKLFGPPGEHLHFVAADVDDDAGVERAVAGATGVVNAVSLYIEKGDRTFRSVHVEDAARVARLARENGVERLLHVSGVGSDPRSGSPYIRSRGEGEEAVLAVFPQATIIRPAVMFGERDALVVPLANLLRRAPIFPLFGQGTTRLQPAYVDDVAAAMVQVLAMSIPLCELGGPDVLTYRSLVELVCRHVGRQPILLPLPFALWQPAAYVAEALPSPPITRNQVELMQHDNVATPDVPGFDSLRIAARSLPDMLPTILAHDA
jgi:NADH dehydrogenase